MSDRILEGTSEECPLGLVTLVVIRSDGSGEMLDALPDGTLVNHDGREASFWYKRPNRAAAAVLNHALGSGSRVAAALVTAEVVSAHDARALWARVRALAQMSGAGQVLLDGVTADLIGKKLPPETGLDPVGSFAVGSETRRDRFYSLRHPHRKSALPEATAEAGLSAFVGRELELEEFHQRLMLSRTVTVAGPCGVGKTTLVRRALIDLDDMFPERHVWIDARGVDGPEMLADRIRTSFGLPLSPDASNPATPEALCATRSILVVLDGADHCEAASAAWIEHMAAQCPNLHAIVTCRTRLHFNGETAYEITGLAVPSPAEHWESIATSDSVGFFVERAQALDPSFRVTADNASEVATIAGLLEGVPSAMELIAPKTRMFTPRQLVAMLRGEESRSPNPSLVSDGSWRAVSLCTRQLAGASRSIMAALSAAPAPVCGGMMSACAGQAAGPHAALAALDDLVDSGLAGPAVGFDEVRHIRLSEPAQLFARHVLAPPKDLESCRRRVAEWRRDLLLAPASEVAVSVDCLQAHYQELVDDAASVLQADISDGMHALCTLGFLWQSDRRVAPRWDLLIQAIESQKAPDSAWYLKFTRIGAELAHSHRNAEVAVKFVRQGLRVRPMDGQSADFGLLCASAALVCGTIGLDRSRLRCLQMACIHLRNAGAVRLSSVAQAQMAACYAASGRSQSAIATLALAMDGSNGAIDSRAQAGGYATEALLAMNAGDIQATRSALTAWAVKSRRIDPQCTEIDVLLCTTWLFAHTQHGQTAALVLGYLRRVEKGFNRKLTVARARLVAERTSAISRSTETTSLDAALTIGGSMSRSEILNLVGETLSAS